MSDKLRASLPSIPCDLESAAYVEKAVRKFSLDHGRMEYPGYLMSDEEGVVLRRELDFYSNSCYGVYFRRIKNGSAVDDFIAREYGLPYFFLLQCFLDKYRRQEYVVGNMQSDTESMSEFALAAMPILLLPITSQADFVERLKYADEKCGRGDGKSYLEYENFNGIDSSSSVSLNGAKIDRSGTEYIIRLVRSDCWRVYCRESASADLLLEIHGLPHVYEYLLNFLMHVVR